MRLDARPGNDGNQPSGGPDFLDRGDFVLHCLRPRRRGLRPLEDGQHLGRRGSQRGSYALDPERAKALWAKSEEMVGERF